MPIRNRSAPSSDDADHVRRDADAAPGRGRPRASTTLNIIQQVGASIGTAVLSVLLVQEIGDRLPGGGGGFGHTLPDAARERVAAAMADAFGATFWWAWALLVVAFVAALALPRHKPEPVHDPDEVDAATAPVLVAH